MKDIRRFYSYLTRSKFRLFLGFSLALIGSLLNILSLSSFIPVFNSIASSDSVQIFSISDSEQKLIERREKKEELTSFQNAQVSILFLKKKINRKITSYTIQEIILRLCIVIAFCQILRTICFSSLVFCLSSIGLEAVRSIRNEIYRNMQKLSLNFFQKEQEGNITSRVIDDGEKVSRLVSVEFHQTFIDIFLIVTHLVFLIIISWKVIFVACICSLIYIVPMIYFSKHITKVSLIRQNRFSELMNSIQELIAGIRVIRAFGMENREQKQFNEINQKLFKDSYQSFSLGQMGPIFTEFLSLCIIIFFIIFGAYEVIHGNLSIGLFFTSMFTFHFIISPIKKVVHFFNILSMTSPSLARMFELMDQKIYVKEDRNAKHISVVKDSICYNNVTFSYPNTDSKTLDSVSFEIRKGENIALVGESGSGKSTIINLLPRLYDINQGEISIDGINIQELKLSSLRSLISIVSQDIFLFHGTILENIAYGREDSTLSLKEVQQAAKIANAHNFIKSSPDGYHTMIGERGITISGGERQRIAIARAVLLNRPILILDEATSNLDYENENLVRQALKQVQENRTTLTIAHRISTVQNVDQILVLEKGQIKEKGTHQMLLKSKGVYHHLYKSLK